MMRKWSKQDDERFEAAKQRYLDDGKPEGVASVLAIREVNKQRAREDHPPDPIGEGFASPDVSLEVCSLQELRHRAWQMGIADRDQMNRKELLNAIRSRQ